MASTLIICPRCNLWWTIWIGTSGLCSRIVDYPCYRGNQRNGSWGGCPFKEKTWQRYNQYGWVNLLLVGPGPPSPIGNRQPSYWYQRFIMHCWTGYSNTGTLAKENDHILVSSRWRILQVLSESSSVVLWYGFTSKPLSLRRPLQCVSL